MNNCILCSGPLERHNASEVCAECVAIVRNLLAVEIPERWRPLEMAGVPGGLLVSDRGQVARLLHQDTAHRYPRVSLAGKKHFVHALVAAAWHGPRPRGALVLHGDDDPNRPHAGNLRYGTHGDNARDRRINRRRKEHHR